MIDGELIARPDGYRVVRFERDVPRPADRVWAALTERKILSDWLGSNAEVDPRVGGKFVIHWPDGDMTGAITVFEPERVLEYTWAEAYAPQSVVRWELTAKGDACRLVLTHTTPPEAQLSDIFSYLGGWHDTLDRLPSATDGAPPPASLTGWLMLERRYREKITGAVAVDEKGQSNRAASLHFERLLPGPIERVWKHLTDTKLLPAWFGEQSSIEPRRGGAVALMGGHIRGVVTQWNPPHRLSYTWNVFNPGDAPDATSAFPESTLTFTLSQHGDEVRLMLSHLPILDRFEKQNAMGWHTFLDILAATIRGEKVEERPVYMKKNAALYSVDLENLLR